MKIKDSIILIVVFVVAIFLGVFIGVKVTDNKSDTNKPNQTENNGDKTTELSTAEVEKIMEKYAIYTCGKSYMTELNNVSMATLAIENAPSEKITCELLKVDGLDTYVYKNTKGILYEQCLMTNNSDFYKYNDVLNSYKNLFGSSKTLNRESFDSDTSLFHYYYSKSNDGFAKLSIPAGFDCDGAEAGLKSFESEENSLEVIAYSKFNEFSDIKTYKYIFGIENGNYYLTEITEVK